MRDTVEARLFVCALAGLLSFVSLASTGLAAKADDLFRGSVTSSGDIKNEAGAVVGKVVLNNGGTFNRSTMRIREDGAVTSMDGKIIGHLLMNLGKSGRPPLQSVYPPKSNSLLGLADRTAMHAHAGAPDSDGSIVSRQAFTMPPNLLGSSAPNLLRGGISTSISPPAPTYADPNQRLSSILGGLNNPGQYPDISVQNTDELTGGFGGIPSPHMMAGTEGTKRSAFTRGGGSNPLHIAKVLGGLNTPGQYPEVGMLTTDGSANRGSLNISDAAQGMTMNPGGAATVNAEAAALPNGAMANNSLSAATGAGAIANSDSVAGGGSMSNMAVAPLGGLSSGNSRMAGAGYAGDQTLSGGGGDFAGRGNQGRLAGTGYPGDQTLSGGGGAFAGTRNNLVSGGPGLAGNSVGANMNSGAMASGHMRSGGMYNAAPSGGGFNSGHSQSGGGEQMANAGGANSGGPNAGGFQSSGGGEQMANAGRTNGGGSTVGASEMNGSRMASANSGSSGRHSGRMLSQRNTNYAAQVENSGAAATRNKKSASKPGKDAAGDSYKQQQLSDLKQRTTARVDSVVNDGTISKKHVSSIRKDIDDANNAEKKFMKDGTLNNKELNNLSNRWDAIMNQLSRFVSRDSKNKSK